MSNNQTKNQSKNVKYENNEATKKALKQMEEDKKQAKKYRFIILGLVIVTLAVGIQMLIDYIMHSDSVAFFNKHFAGGICLILLGIISFLMPPAMNRHYNSGKGEDTMFLVSILLVLSGLVYFGISFVIM